MEKELGILAGIRVIDCSTYIAGPAAASVMADFGAEVFKIERPPFGDPYRYLPLLPGMPVSDLNYCWILTGRNKKSLALNLGDPAGRDVLLKLVATADVFITNFQPALVSKFQLAYEDLRPLNQRLIYGYITGYGETGDDAGKPGYDATAYWARSGLMATLHNGDAEPCPSPAGFGDHPTAMTLFSAIMLALYQRNKSGLGMKVDTSLMANGAWSNACQVQAALCGAVFEPKRTRATTFNPLVNHYVTRDKQRLFFCLLDPKKDWPQLCRALARPELIDDPRFQSPYDRRQNGPALVSIIDQEIAGKTMAEWTALFKENDVIWGPVPTTTQVAEDTQMAANGVFSELEYPGQGLIQTVNNPINLHGFEKVKPKLAPNIGEHTVEILRELGYQQGVIEELLNRGIVAA